MEHLTIESFKEKIMDFDTHKEDWKFAGELPAVIKYTADWCSPCRTLNPILESLSNEYKDKINIYEIDVDAEPELSSLFNIRNIPTILFIPMIGEPKISIGTLTKSKLKESIEKLLK